MWMYVKMNMLVAEWDDKCPSHMALHNPTHQTIKRLNNNHKWQLSWQCNQSNYIYPPQLSLMVISGNFNSIAIVFNPSPMQFHFPLAAAEPRSHTTTSSCCNILCYIEFGLGNHFTQSLICNLILHLASVVIPSSEPTSKPVAPSHHSELSPSRHSPPPGVKITRIFHTMQSRRGSSKGRLPHSPPSPTLDASSPSAQLTTC